MHTNYTPEDTQLITKLYLEGASIDELAEQFNKTKRSVIAKLSRLGVYKTPVNQPRITKMILVKQISELLKVSELEIDTLEKATLISLKELVKHL